MLFAYRLLQCDFNFEFFRQLIVQCRLVYIYMYTSQSTAASALWKYCTRALPKKRAERCNEKVNMKEVNTKEAVYSRRR